MEQLVSFLFKYRGAIFAKSQFAFGTHPSVWTIAVLVVVAAALLYYLYAGATIKLPANWRAALVAIRLCLLAVIIFCLMRPVIVLNDPDALGPLFCDDGVYVDPLKDGPLRGPNLRHPEPVSGEPESRRIREPRVRR